MSFDINAKINKLKSEISTKERDLLSFNSANYDGNEDKNIKKIEKEISQLKKELLKWETTKKMASTKDSMEILRLSGFTVDEEVSPKFKKVMEEYGKGELESSSGEKVTDPKQAKAIAYSESKDSSSLEPQINQLKQKINNLYDKAGDALNEKNKEKYNIIMSQIKVEEKNLNALIRASMQDSCGEKVFTKGTEDAYKDGELSPKEELIKYAEKTKDPEYIKHVKEMNNFKNINARLQWHRQNEDGCSTKDYDYEDETMTTAEARQYWNRYHNSDPILKMYKSFEEWYRESKINGYIKDADPKVAEAEAIINLCGGVK